MPMPGTNHADVVRTATESLSNGNRNSAAEAGLRYATDDTPGISRRRSGRGFSYRAVDGRVVDRPTLARIRALVIPPAWTSVWIAADPTSHLQATGRDARGRKQYRYHARWSATRDRAKYDHTLVFARALPAIRRRVDTDLRGVPLSREWVLATVVRILDRTVIRVGNEEYARANGSFGLTTLRNRHARVHGAHLRLQFRAKSGVMQTVDVADRQLARAVRRCQELPGQTLFQYQDGAGQIHAVGSTDVNEYLRKAAGADLSAKDFRTWAGTVAAARHLAARPIPPTLQSRRREIVGALDAVARQLGNTRAVCRKCYVHPAVLQAYLDGAPVPARAPTSGGQARLDPAERALIRFLKGAPDRVRHRVQ
jgi:DNA topoisomerase-1